MDVTDQATRQMLTLGRAMLAAAEEELRDAESRVVAITDQLDAARADRSRTERRRNRLAWFVSQTERSDD